MNVQERINRAESTIQSDHPDWYKAWLEFSAAADLYVGDDLEVSRRLRRIAQLCHKKSLPNHKERKHKRASERLEKERAMAYDARCRTPSAWTHTGSPPISRQSLTAALIAGLHADGALVPPLPEGGNSRESPSPIQGGK